MGEIEDYSVGKRLSARAKSHVSLGVRRSDGAEVVLKTRLGSRDAWLRAESELDALRRAVGPGVVTALDLVRGPECATLVLERAPGASLLAWVERDGPLASEVFVEIGLQIACTLAQIHDARLVHRNLSPAHVLVDPWTRETHVVGFGLARTVGATLGADARTSEIERTGVDLKYMSPEQTGRMERGVDTRSDLYSLGATLYFALSGAPPFPGDDPLALTHAHLAKVPRPPHELRPEVPLALSRIVMRLLSKSPEERYQHAASLQRDLTCCRQALETTRSIPDDLPLAGGDVPHRPSFGKRLYGRSDEIERLRAWYQRSAAGEFVTVLLEGPAGVGKSALIDVLRGPLGRDGGHLAVGKFDPYRREQPHLGFVEGLRDVSRQLLTESDGALARWRSELVSALGSSAGVIADLVPELRVVLGEVPPANPLGPVETRLRVGLALQRLLQVLATPAHPLVLFLDDLQWADAGSLELLSDVILDRADRALLLVCARRDDRASAGDVALHDFWRGLRDRGAVIESLPLGALNDEACAELLAEALCRDRAETRALARCVARKTGNVPLSIQQFVLHVLDEGHIRFVPDVGWSWNDAELAAAKVPDSAVGLLSAKIARLPEAMMEVLELASCLGRGLDQATLDALGARPGAEGEAALFALCDEGLIVPTPAGFGFVHDRIREAVQAYLPAARRAALHARVAAYLLERTPAESLDERVFEIADHVTEARAGGLEAVPRLRALLLYARACGRALKGGAGAAALHYFSAAEGALRESDWADHLQLCIQLFLDGADAAHQCEAFAEADRCLAVLLEHPLAPLQRIQVHARLIRTSSVTKPRPETVELALRLLGEGGVRWSRNPGKLRLWWDVLVTDWRLRKPLDEIELTPCAPGDIEKIAVVLLFQAAGQSLSLTSWGLVLRAAAFVLRTYHRFGYLVSPSFALAAYCAYRLRFTGRLRPVLRLAEAARAWNKRIRTPVYEVQSETVLLAYFDAWIKPRQDLIAPLRRVSEAAADAGEFEYACLSDAIRNTLMATVGRPLPEVVRATQQMNWSRWSYAMSLPYTLAFELYATLWDEGRDLESAMAEAHAVHPATRDLYLYVSLHVMTVRLVLCEYRQVLAESERVYAPMLKAQMGTNLADFIFLRGFAAGAVARGARGRERRAARRALRSSLRYMRGWARPGSDFVHMQDLLESEHRRLRNDARSALIGYEQAARRARVHGHRHHAAMALERRAELLLEMGRITEGELGLRESIALYEEWGAPLKAARLAARLAE